VPVDDRYMIKLLKKEFYRNRAEDIACFEFWKKFTFGSFGTKFAHHRYIVQTIKMTSIEAWKFEPKNEKQ